MSSLAIVLCGFALAFCAALGLGSLLNPQWAARTVRLVPDPDPSRPGGFSEFRATYGGLLFGLHASALFFLVCVPLDYMASLALLLPIGLAWVATGFGRALSLVLDTADNRAKGLIPIWIPFEIILGLVILAPIAFKTY